MIPDHSNGRDGHSPRTRRGPLPLRCGWEHPEVAARADSISIDALQARFFELTFFHEFAARPPRNFKCISLHAAYTKLMLEPAIAVGPLALGPPLGLLNLYASRLSGAHGRSVRDRRR
jgi:hypothetical protein